MSYRYRFASAKKENVDKLKDMSIDELKRFLSEANPSALDGEGYVQIWELFGQKEFYDFFGCDFVNKISEKGIPLFTASDTAEELSGYDAKVCNKDVLLFAIDELRKSIQNYLQVLSEDESCAKAHLTTKAREWQLSSEWFPCDNMSDEKVAEMNARHLPYNIDVNNPRIINSARFEYTIFELVYAYKHFDWENNYLIFYGW